jgi:uncharacterized membrane protein
MSRVEKQITVDVPVRAAYEQWTQFEDFPRFMEHVSEVRQIDDRRLHWKANIAGRDQEWDAVIREQLPDQRIIWDSEDGARNAGIVSFEPLNAGQTRIWLQMSYQPEGLVEHVGDALGTLEREVETDLENFKHFIEERRTPTGAFRGEIHNPDAPGGHTAGHPNPAEGGGPPRGAA